MMPSVKRPADRTKAKRIRQAMEEDPDDVSDDDRAWLEHYERTQRGGKVGKSATRKLVHIEEEAAAEGDHPHPAAYESMVRAEGLRADTMFRLQIDAMTTVNEQLLGLLKFLTDRTVRLEEAHIGLLDAVRGHFLSRTQTEAEMMRLQALQEAAGDDEDGEFLKILSLVGAARQAAGQDPKSGKAVKKKRKPSKPLGAVDQG